MYKTISVILIALFIILGVSYDCFADDAEDLYNEGMKFYHGDDLTTALKYFKDSTMKNPSFAAGYYGIGLVYSRGGDYEAAVENYTQALKNKPAGHASGFTDSVLWERAKAYDSMNKELQAAADYREACYTYNNDESCTVLRKKAEAWEDKGLSYKRKKDYIYAKSSFSRAIKIDPKYLDPYFHRGQVNEKLNHDDAAINDFNKYIELTFESSGQDAPVYDAYFSIGLIASKKAKNTGNKQYWVSAEKIYGLAINNLARRHTSEWPKSTPDYYFRIAEAIVKQGGDNNKKRALRYLQDGCNFEKKHSSGGNMRCCRHEDWIRDKLGLERRTDWD